MLPKYNIGKIPPIYSISATLLINGVFGNPSCYFVYDYITQILCTVPHDAQS